MARKHPVAETPAGGALILPVGAGEVQRHGRRRLAAHAKAQTKWLRDHGVDPGDWTVVHAIMLASRKVHGRPSALDYHRLVCAGGD